VKSGNVSAQCVMIMANSMRIILGIYPIIIVLSVLNLNRSKLSMIMGQHISTMILSFCVPTGKTEEYQYNLDANVRGFADIGVAAVGGLISIDSPLVMSDGVLCR